jgi:hypothetical protein
MNRIQPIRTKSIHGAAKRVSSHGRCASWLFLVIVEKQDYRFQLPGTLSAPSIVPLVGGALWYNPYIYNPGTKSFRESVRLKPTHASRSCEAKIATTIRHIWDDNNTPFFCEISLDRHTPHHPMQWPKYSYICTLFLFYI